MSDVLLEKILALSDVQYVDALILLGLKAIITSDVMGVPATVGKNRQEVTPARIALSCSLLPSAL